MNNKKKLFIATSVALTLIVIIGITYAWMTQVVSGTKVNKIKVGALNLTLDDEASNGINITNGLPQSNEQGLNNTEYTFSVENSGATNAKYNIYLEDEELESGEERISDSNVKYYLVRNDEESEPKLLSTTIEENKRVIDKDVIINTGSTNNYSLKLWIDENSTQEEVGGKVFKAKIKLEAVQTEESNGPVYKYTNSHIKAAYTYQEGEGNSLENYTGCLGGEEAGCEQISLRTSDNVPTGTIVKYEVKPGVEKFFNVLYDNGDTLTMQQRENTVYSVAWYGEENSITNGPLTVLLAIESATADWEYVNNQTYTAGETVFGTGEFATANTACDYEDGATVNATQCNQNIYPQFTKTNVKARIITAQEAGEMGCKMWNRADESTEKLCKKFMNNYLYQSPSYDGTVEDNYHVGGSSNSGYWTLSTLTTTPLYVRLQGYIYYHNRTSGDFNWGARAVVVVNK